MMMRQIMVRYTVKPDRVAENEQLVRDVYEELRRQGPDGFQYATFRLEDGVTFVHLAVSDDGDDNPLSNVEAFGRFQENIRERCDEPPVVSRLHEVGSYRLLRSES
jgi:hypothetical protein